MSASARPARQTKLPSKYAENGDEPVVTSHRRTITSSLVPVPSSSASDPLPSTAPTGFDHLSSPPDPSTEASTKRPRAQPGLPIDDDADTTDALSDAPKTKKLKKAPSQTVGLQNEASIISIDDVDDLRDKRLNKSDPTVDIKEFYIPIPLAPGQDKGHMLCKLCQ